MSSYKSTFDLFIFFKFLVNLTHFLLAHSNAVRLFIFNKSLSIMCREEANEILSRSSKGLVASSEAVPDSIKR